MIDGMPAQLPESRPRASWTATSRPGRLLLALAATLALVAVLLFAQGLRREPGLRLLVLAGPAAAAVDPAGCPIGARCRAGAIAPPAMLAAITRAFPNSRLIAVSGVSEAATGRPFRVVVSVQLDPSATMTLTAQRLPGSPANDPDSADNSVHSHDDLSGNQVVDDTVMRLIVGGRPGCSVSIEMSSPGQDSPFGDATLRLSRDPDVELTP
jgi:hypothetical protein